MVAQEVSHSPNDTPTCSSISSEPLSPVNTLSPPMDSRQFQRRAISREHSSRQRRGRMSRGLLTSRSFVLLLTFLLFTSIPLHNDREKGHGMGGLSLFLASAEDAQDDNYGDDDGQVDDDGQDNDDGENDDYYADDNVSFDLDFSEVSIMPVSCINFNKGHLIKYELFESQNNYQCHFKSLGQFIVSINHFMTAYFNYQVLQQGRDFSLPGDVAFLNCVMLQETAYSEQKLYAKVGCQQKDSYTSTKLALRVFTDRQCSNPYDDGQSDAVHANRGYDINGYTFSTKVSFRPAFYSCQTCTPSQISNTFSKSTTDWYDDDYINTYGSKRVYYDDDAHNDADADEDAGDDAYFAVKDDDDGFHYAYNPNYDDKFYAFDDDDDDVRDRERMLVKTLTPAEDETEAYHAKFWEEMDRIARDLEDQFDAQTNIGDWNFCQRLHYYGIWCDEECRAIDVFHVNEWSKSDIFLLVIMGIFMGAMMALILRKRTKAYQKFALYDGLDLPSPGLPPMAMGMIFVLIIAAVVVLASLKFVNETLVFSVVTCILLFIYMLKLTLFDSKSGQLLSAPRPSNVNIGSMNQSLFN